jgi:hypothetical protein
MLKPTVFTDFHHSGLLASLIRLFEGRLGGQVYRPIGEEWHTNGYWKIYDHPATVKQFLGINGATPDGTPKLNDVLGRLSSQTGNIYACRDISNGGTNKAIDFDGFMNSHFDIVIASIPAHIEPFKKLCALHPSHPKLIYQVGNAWSITDGTSPNIMASAIINNVPAGINYVEYHQEFDTKLFTPQPMPEGKRISSFVNCFSLDGLFANDWQLFQDVESLMSEYTFKCYGGQCRDGVVAGEIGVAEEMADSLFVWHTKCGGDGYGHIIHNAPACGRPLIVKKEYYNGKMADKLLIDGQTCLTIDGMGIREVMNKIAYYSRPKEWQLLSDGAAAKFKEVVDFDKEAIQILEFLGRLI